MQHHGAILCNVAGAAEVLERGFRLGDDERFLSFLPLSHAYEHTGGQFLPIGCGAEIYYSEGLEKLASNIEETQPTIMVVVPRLFEVLRARIMKQVEKQGRVPNYLMTRALEIARPAESAACATGRCDMVIEKLLRPKIRARFGGRIKAMVIGRRAAQSRGRHFLRSHGADDAARLRPDRGRAGDQLQPPHGGHQDGHRRPAAERASR